MTSVKKILLTNSSDIYAGGEYFVFMFGKYLKEKGYDVTISCRSDILLYNKAESEDIKLFKVDFPRNGEVFKYGKIIYNFVKKNNIGIVHTNVNYDRTVAGYAAKLAGAGHIAMVHSYHSISHNLTHYIRNNYFTDYYLVDGHCTKKLLIDKNRINSNLIKVVHLGIDPDSMKRDFDLRKKVRNEFGIDDNVILFGNTARYVEFKGQEYLIKAFSKICNQYNDIKLMIVGYGKLENNLKRLVKELGIAEKVIFTGFRDDMQAIYSAYDIYLHSSIEGGGETFPFSVLFSLAQGIPAIVTDVGDVSMMIENEISGFSVTDKDPDAMAEKMAYFLRNRKLISEFGEKALLNLYDKFTIQIMFEKIINIYNNIK